MPEGFHFLQYLIYIFSLDWAEEFPLWYLYSVVLDVLSVNKETVKCEQSSLFV